MQAGLAGRHRVKQTKQRGTQTYIYIERERDRYICVYRHIHIHIHRFYDGIGLLSSANIVMAQRCRPYVVGNLVAARPSVIAQHIVAGREMKQFRCHNMMQGSMHRCTSCFWSTKLYVTALLPAEFASHSGLILGTVLRDSSQTVCDSDCPWPGS
jgi:hypothetical protein